MSAPLKLFFKIPFRGGVVIVITPLPLGRVEELYEPVSMS
jgi:hypothetical protein